MIVLLYEMPEIMMIFGPLNNSRLNHPVELLRNIPLEENITDIDGFLEVFDKCISNVTDMRIKILNVLLVLVY